MRVDTFPMYSSVSSGVCIHYVEMNAVITAYACFKHNLQFWTLLLRRNSLFLFILLRIIWLSHTSTLLVHTGCCIVSSLISIALYVLCTYNNNYVIKVFSSRF